MSSCGPHLALHLAAEPLEKVRQVVKTLQLDIHLVGLLFSLSFDVRIHAGRCFRAFSANGNMSSRGTGREQRQHYLAGGSAAMEADKGEMNRQLGGRIEDTISPCC